MKDKSRARWWQWTRKREERALGAEKELWESIKDHVGVANADVLTCPRCRRDVVDTERGRQAHGVSCVRIPKNRSKLWGMKVRNR